MLLSKQTTGGGGGSVVWGVTGRQFCQPAPKAFAHLGEGPEFKSPLGRDGARIVAPARRLAQRVAVPATPFLCGPWQARVLEQAGAAGLQRLEPIFEAPPGVAVPVALRAPEEVWGRVGGCRPGAAGVPAARSGSTHRRKRRRRMHGPRPPCTCTASCMEPCRRPQRFEGRGRGFARGRRLLHVVHTRPPFPTPARAPPPVLRCGQRLLDAVHQRPRPPPHARCAVHLLARPTHLGR